VVAPEVFTVSCELPEPARDPGENEQLAPFGNPEQASVTVLPEPPIAVIDTADVAEPPAITVAGERAAAEI
jgi:hypothetical protein